MKKTIILALILLAAVISITSCTKKNEVVETSKNTKTTTTTKKKKEPEKPKFILNRLTGVEDLASSADGNRPISIMISNIKTALPQKGIGEADIVYETVAEGGITRCMGLFADIDKIPTVGPVRSVREYYTDFALPYNTIFVHWGGSVTGYEMVKERKVQNIDGNEMGTSIFTQDKKRAANLGREHSFYINSDGIKKGIQKKNYKLQGDSITAFNFATKEKPATIGTVEANTITVPFSHYATSIFNFDLTTKKYLKSQFNQPHIDETTKKQIAVDNVFVLYVPQTIILTKLSRFDLSGDTGYYINNGKATPITYTKSKYNSQFKFFDQNGQEIVVATGKSYVCVVPKQQEALFSTK